MISITPVEENSRIAFTEKLKSYRKNISCNCARITNHPNNAIAIHPCSSSLPEPNETFILNRQALLALKHSIEDLATAVTSGRIVTLIQDFQNFEWQRNRYTRLSRNLHSLRVWGIGPPPDLNAPIDFIPTTSSTLKQYRGILFSSNDLCAMLIGKQLQFRFPDDIYYIGYLSFDPFIIEDTLSRMELVTSGIEPLIQEWENHLNIPAIPFSSLTSFFRKRYCSP